MQTAEQRHDYENLILMCVATDTPTSLKNSSWPAGEQMQSSRTGLSEPLWN
jgi:hypothetical protein